MDIDFGTHFFRELRESASFSPPPPPSQMGRATSLRNEWMNDEQNLRAPPIPDRNEN